MKNFVYLVLDADFKDFTLLRKNIAWLKQHHVDKVLLSGDLVTNTHAYNDVINLLLKNFRFVHIQIGIEYLETIKQTSSISGFIFRFDNNLKELHNYLPVLNTLHEAKRNVGIKIFYKQDYGRKYIKEYLEILRYYRFNDLIFESPADYLETVNKDEYIALFLDFNDFLEDINFQCDFIDELRPKECIFLYPDNKNYVIKNGYFDICPYYDIRIDDMYPVDNEHDALLSEVKKQILKYRLINYIQKGKAFNCACSRIARI